MNIGCRPLLKEEITSISEKLSLRDKTLFLLSLATGYRISELLSLKLKEIREYGNIKDYITVTRRHMKGKENTRSIPLSDDIKMSLNEYISTLPENQEYLFETIHGKLSRYQAWRSIKKAVHECKLTGNIATHSGRKTFAKNVYEASGNDIILVKSALGHNQIASTMKYMSFITNSEVNKVILKISKK